MTKLLALLFITTQAFATTITTPNMSLVLPVPGSEPGPTWAQDLNTAFTLLDSHTHAPGSGVQVPTAGLNINASLQMNDWDLLLPRSIMFTNQSATLGTSNDKNNIYAVNGNLYFNNASGTPVQITSGGAVNTGGSGSISGMGSTTAGVTYSNITKTFSFTQSSGVTADLAAGSVNLYEDVAASNPVTLKSPTSLSSAYSLTMPTALPASLGYLTISSTGQLAAATHTPIQSSNVNISSSAGSETDMTGLTVTITTTGRPVMLMIGTGSAASGSYFQATAASAADVFFTRDASDVGALHYGNNATGTNSIPASSFMFIDPSPSAGAHTYKMRWIAFGGGTISCSNCVLTAYEL